MTDPHEAIEEFFARFAQAVADGDVETFRALKAPGAVVDTELFVSNAAWVRDAGASLRLREIRQEGEVAEVLFDLADGAGARVDTGQLTLTLEADGWRVASL